MRRRSFLGTVVLLVPLAGCNDVPGPVDLRVDNDDDDAHEVSLRATATGPSEESFERTFAVAAGERVSFPAAVSVAGETTVSAATAAGGSATATRACGGGRFVVRIGDGGSVTVTPSRC